MLLEKFYRKTISGKIITYSLNINNDKNNKDQRDFFKSLKKNNLFDIEKKHGGAKGWDWTEVERSRSKHGINRWTMTGRVFRNPRHERAICPHTRL